MESPPDAAATDAASCSPCFSKNHLFSPLVSFFWSNSALSACMLQLFLPSSV